METGAATFLLWIMLQLLPSSEAVTCSEIAQCEYNSQEYANAQVKGDMTTLCNLLGNSIKCMDMAMGDCMRNFNIPDNKLQQARKVLDMHKKQVQASCPRVVNSMAKASGSERSGINSPRTRHDIAEIPANPSCAEIVNCTLDLDQFRAAIRDNHLTEACGLIMPSVRCLRQALNDCKEARIFDDEDLTIATHALLENHCRYPEDKDSMKVHTSVEIPAGKNAEEQRANPSSAVTRSAEHLDGSKATKSRVSSNDKTSENKINGTKGISDTGKNSEHGSGNSASIQVMSLRFGIFLLLLNI